MSHMSQMQVEAAASAPPVAVAGLTVLGVGISDWVQIVALIWLLLQIGHFVYTKIVKRERR